MKSRSGGGIIGLIGLAVVFLVLRRFVPALATVFLILCAFAVLGVAALVAVVIFFAFRTPKKTPEQQRTEEANAVIQRGRAQLMEIRRLVMKLKDPEIRRSGESICSVLDRIPRALKDQPDDILRVGRFFHYYLPTLQSILTKYSRLEANGVPDSETEKKTLSCLQDMEAAMEKQYRNLFEDDKLDLSVEMVVLTRICRRDGLLAEDCQLPELPKAEQGITLTL